MRGKHLTEVNEEERQRRFLQKITKGNEGLATPSYPQPPEALRRSSPPLPKVLGHRLSSLKKGKEDFTEDNEGNEGVRGSFKPSGTAEPANPSLVLFSLSKG
jgi:hypothetical protein